MFTKKEIARHFELCEEHYTIWWGLKKSKSMHYGFWEADTKTLHEALQNINSVMAKKVAITASDHVLDAGCGVGGSSIWLSKNIGCSVTGITLSELQCATARSNAKEAGVNGKTCFLT